MLVHWYMLLGQFSVTLEYLLGAQHANADGMSRQCGQCMSPGCPVSCPDLRVDDVDSVIQWMRTYCQNYLGKHGWWPPIWMNLRINRVGSGFCRSIPAGCDLDHGTQVGPVRNGPCVVGVCGIINSCRHGKPECAEKQRKNTTYDFYDNTNMTKKQLIPYTR